MFFFKKDLFLYLLVWYKMGKSEDCQQPNLPANTIQITKENDIYKDKSVLYYKCEDGYNFFILNSSESVAQHKIQCVAGTWEPKPLWKCADHCQNNCGNHGRCEKNNSDETSYSCVCNINYAGEHCDQKVCEAPILFPHGKFQLISGQVKFNKYSGGSRIQYSCAAGYNIRQGSTSAHCNDNGWDPGYVPKCEEIECENAYKGNSLVQYLPMQTRYHVGAMVQFSCDRSTLLGSSKSTCEINGYWSSPWPYCTPLKSCLQPSRIFNGQYEPDRGEFTHGSVARYSCKKNYMISGDSHVTCSNGYWIGIIPKCTLPDSFCDQQSSNNCLEKVTKQDSTTQPLILVAGTAGGLLMLLLLLIVAVACQRRRIARRIDRQRYINGDDDRCSFVYYSNDVHVVLPSYDEAMLARRFQPPPYNENIASQNNSSQNEASGENAYESIQEVTETSIFHEVSESVRVSPAQNVVNRPLCGAAYAEVQRISPSLSESATVSNQQNSYESNESCEFDDDKQLLIND